MKKILTIALALFVAAGSVSAAKKKSAAKQSNKPVFTIVKEIPVTSMKDQNRSGTCWDYSTLSFFEAEILKATGKKYDLCESFIANKTYMDRAIQVVRYHGDCQFAQGGSAEDVLATLKTHGICPEDAMPFPGSLYGDSLYNFNEMWPIAQGLVQTISKSKNKKIPLSWKSTFSEIMDGYFGKVPTTFEYKGKTYTPQTFAQSLGLNYDDYVSLTSYTHHPFYGKFILEIQDNWRWAESYNLPLNEFMEVMESAVRNGYTFAWGADVSEPYFDRGTGVVQCPAVIRDLSTAGSDAARWTGKATTEVKGTNDKGEANITQELRQTGYDNWETTDDHGMVIYGIAKDQDGKEFYMVKNSWGEYGKYKGMFYVSKPYVAYKTMNILINKNAIPKQIRKKLGI